MTQSLYYEINHFFYSLGWLAIAISGYFLLAVVSVFDKYLLNARISKPAVYAFYVALFSLFVVCFIPFGVVLPSPNMLILSVVSGFFFIYGLLALYRAVQENEISRVAPLVGMVITLSSILYANILLGQKLEINEYVAVALLVLGGFMVSFELPISNLNLFKGFKYSVISGICQAISLGLLKEVFGLMEKSSGQAFFLNGFFWNRIGFFLAGISLLTFPVFRKQILDSFKIKNRSKKKAFSTSSLFIANKVMAGTGSLLIVLAISRGSVPSVNSVGSIQFAFILAIVAILSMNNKNIFKERLEFSDWVQKIFAVVLIGIGIWMLSLGDGRAFYLSS